MSAAMNKKLDKFRDENGHPSRRIKSLQSFVDHATEAEVKKVFAENSSIIYSLVLGSFELWCQQASTTTGKGGKQQKGKASVQDLFAILIYLKKIFVFQPELVRTRWQSRSIGSLLEALLVQENKHQIRMFGWELLLLYLGDMGEALDESRDKKFCSFFRSVMDFEPFVSGYVSDNRDIVLKNAAVSGPKPCSPAIPVPPPLQLQKDCVELLDKLLEYMSASGAQFPFWIRLFKQSILVTLYPRVCKVVGLLADQDPTGFTTYCPREVQKLVVSWVIKWVGTPDQFAVISGTKENMTLLLELFRQAMELPLNYNDTTDSVIDQMHKWVQGSNRPAVMESPEDIQDYFREFIRLFALRFQMFGDRQPTTDGLKQVTLCKRILNIFVELSIQAKDPLSDETWVLLLNTITDICHTLFAEHQPSSPNALVSQELAATALETLFTCWIRSRRTDSELWEVLQEKLKQCCEWKEVVVQWRRAFVQLSCMYCMEIYQTTEVVQGFDMKNPSKTDIAALESRSARSSAETDTPGSPQAPTTTEGDRARKKKDVATLFMSKGEQEANDQWEARVGAILVDGTPIQESILWDQDTLEFIWQRVFHVLGNIAEIVDPQINALALQTFELVVDIFLKFDTVANRRVEGNMVPHLMVLFAPWLFEACSLSVMYQESVVIAYGAMCRLFCRRFDEPDDEVLDYYLSHLYGFLHEGLTGEDKSVLCAIIEHSSNLFGLCFKGMNILIPDYLRAIRRMMNITFQPAPSEKIRVAAITLLTSLICFPNHHPEVLLPDLKYTVMMSESQSQEADDGAAPKKSLPFVELKNSIASLLFAIIKDEYFTTTKCMCLWGLCVQIMEELHHNPKEVVVVKCVKMIQSHCVNSDAVVARTAVDVFVSLSACFELLEQVDSTIITMIIEGLCGDAIDMIQQLGSSATTAGKKKPTEETVIAMYQCLTDWIFFNPVELLSDRSIAQKVFEAIEFGLFGEKDAGQKIPPRSPQQPAQKLTEMMDKKRQTVADMQKRQTVAAAQQQQQASLVAPSPLILVAEAAEIMVIQLLRVVNNFPSPLGASRMASVVSETDDNALGLVEGSIEEALTNAKNLRYFVHNGRSVMCFVELEKEDGSGTFCRIIVRDLAGKSCVDTSLEYSPFEGEEPEAPGSADDGGEEQGFFAGVSEPGEVPEEESTHPPDDETPEEPAEDEGDKEDNFAPISLSAVKEETGEDGDILETLVGVVDSTYGELSPSPCDPSIHEVVPAIPASLSEDLQTVAELFQFQHSTENDSIVAMEKKECIVVKPPPVVPKSPFDSCRVLLSQLGLIYNPDVNSFIPLDNSGKLQRSLKALDMAPGREMLKVGVIFVGPGQDDQKVILRNSHGQVSDGYNAFVNSLGWKVDLATHKGFIGGLDRNLTNGTHSIYWANASFEVMFHVAAMMPSSASDAQQIAKKKHIGNDIVHVVWSEHHRDYRPTTITSQFNDAHLAVYPLPNGLFRIQIFYKKKIQMFGPLLDGMIISKELLAPLVRQTAINANRMVRYNTIGYKRPFPTRRDLLEELVGRYTVDVSFDQYMMNMFSVIEKEASA